MKTKTIVVLLVAFSAALSRAEDARVKRAEVKFVIKGDKEEINRSLRALVAENKSEQQEIFFYDTVDRQLDAKGLVLRARRKPEDDTTVKYRSSTPLGVSKWEKDDGFKSELDYIGAKSILSHSLKRPSSGKDFNVGGGEARKLFEEAQQKFAAYCFKAELPWEKLKPCGPIPATAWEKIKLAGFDRDIDVELWADPKAQPVLEVSTKIKNATEGELKKIRQALQTSLEAKGIHVNEDAKSKTASALSRCFGEKTEAGATATPSSNQPLP